MKDQTENQRGHCPQCGAPRHPRGALCTECGVRLETLDEAHGARLAPPVEAPLNEKPDPEKLWWQGFDTSNEANRLEQEGRGAEARELTDRALVLWTQALEAGVQGKSEVTCHWFLGNEFYDRAIDLDAHHRLSTEPLDQIADLSKGVAHLEKAVELDAQIGNFIFGDKLNQADLLKLDMVWGSQAMYIQREFGAEDAIKFVAEKIKLIQHLRVLLPSLFLSFGYIYSEAGSVGDAIDLFRVATKAEDYGDVIEPEDWRYRTAQIAKKNAANNLKYLEVHGKAP